MEENNKVSLDATLAFFDDVFEKVPAMYRQMDATYTEQQSSKQQKKKAKEKGVSLANLNEKAQAMIAEI